MYSDQLGELGVRHASSKLSLQLACVRSKANREAKGYPVELDVAQANTQIQRRDPAVVPADQRVHLVCLPGQPAALARESVERKDAGPRDLAEDLVEPELL